MINGLAAPWALLLVIVFLRWQPTLLLVAPMMVYGLFSMLASSLVGHEPTNVLRFVVIVFGTLLALHFKPAPISLRWALLPIAIQAILIAVVSLSLTALQDLELAAFVRSTVVDAAWGDIYSFDGIYYRVQLKGNALLPLVFLISLWRYRQARYYRWMFALSALGIMAAGNLTYYIVVALALLMRNWQFVVRSATTRIVATAAVATSALFACTAVNEVLEQKFGGSDSSMGVRFDQWEVASDYLSQSPTRALFGAGLGASFPDGRERKYSEELYIEVQSLYLLYQLGLVGMAMYVGTLLISTRHFLNQDGRRIFWLYILSGITNPYILDSNQIIATVLLVCLFSRSSTFDQPRGSLPSLPKRAKRSAR